MGLRAHDSLRSAPLSSSWALAMDTDGWTAVRGDVPRASPTTPVRDFWRSPRLRAAGCPRVYSRSDLDRQQFGDRREIIRARDHLRPELRARHATVARLPQAPDRFAPAEDLFDELPLALTYRVPGMPSRAAVHVRAAMRSNVLRDMGRHAALAELVDERCPIVRLVPGHGCDRHPGRLLHIDHRERRLRFGGPCRLGHAHIDDETVPIFGQRMSREDQLRLFAGPFAHQPRLGVGRGRMRLVAPLLAVKVDGRVPAIVGRRPVAGRFVPRAEALERGPGLDQRPVDREVFGRDQAGGLRAVNDPGQEIACDVGLEQALYVLGQGGAINDVALDPEPEENAEQEVVVQLLAELALAAYAVEGNQQQRLEQALWRDGWPTPLRIDRVEGRRQARELRIGQRLDAPNRMVLRHAVLGIDNAEHRSLPLDFSPHPPLLPRSAIDLRRREGEQVAHFSAPC